MKMSDSDALHEILSDPAVMEFLEDPLTEERTQEFLETAGLNDPPLIYAVEDNEGFIGYVIYHDYDEESVEIGWVLKQSVWNRGYAKKLTKLLIDRARSDNKNVILECIPEQKVTRHIAQSYGFSHTGRRENCDVYRLDLRQKKG